MRKRGRKWLREKDGEMGVMGYYLNQKRIGWLRCWVSRFRERVEREVHLLLRDVSVPFLHICILRLMVASRAPLASINPDQPTVDPSSISNIAGPSSPPARRRKRQEDLLDPEPHHTLSGQPARPPRNPARNPSADILDNQTGTFATDDQDDEELDDETDAIGSYRRVEDYAAPMDFAQHSRSYDDEDAALQAALKASMDDLPADWVPPKLEPKEKPIEKRPLPSPAAPAPAISTAGVPAVSGPASGSKFKEEIEDDDDAPVEELSPGESF